MRILRELMHRYFTLTDWGVVWPGDASLANVTFPPPPPLDHGFEVAISPFLSLTTFLLGILLNYGRSIGSVACAWRVSYSPRGPAFGIWCVIYLWTIASFGGQVAHGYLAPTYLATPSVNYLMAGAWAFVGAWGVTFGRGAKADQPGFIGLAAFMLVAASILALTAVAVEQSWRSGDPWRIVGVGMPYALFAGWLSVAASVNVGIAVVAATREPDPRCTRGRYRSYNALVEEEQTSRAARSSWVPLLVATFISGLAFLIPDPVLVVPAAWGIWFMRRSVKNWVAIEVLAITCVACVVEVVTRTWVV
tara:strand:- start:10195 stop:11112 length:918 start_codon:yes stop_codon:yes gene_type:complete